MNTVCESETLETLFDEFEEYEVGDRVLFRASVNNPQHQAPGEKVRGTVIARFRNPLELTYRIKLDIVWNDDVPVVKGKNIIVGNISWISLSRIT